MALKYLEDSGYRDGMIRDEHSSKLPPGAVYDALNMLFDSQGIARLRGKTTALTSPYTGTDFKMLGFSFSQDLGATQEALYVATDQAGDFFSVNPTTGAIITTWASAGGTGTVGRPLRHFGNVIFPLNDTSALAYNNGIMAGGYTGAAQLITAATAAVTANNPLITLSGADSTTGNVFVGQLVQYTITGSTRYYGRVLSVLSPTTFTVTPTPTVGGTIAIGMRITPYRVIPSLGACLSSFQNRLLAGNSYDVGAKAIGASTTVLGRRVIYSPLPTEQVTTTIAASGGTLVLDGANYMDPDRWPIYNFFDVPGADPIVGMEAVSDNELLILTSTHPVVFRGNLVTQLATTSQQVTFDITEIDSNAGCLSERSMQRTPRGIIWAGTEGIFVYKNGAVDDLTKDKINTYWRGLQAGGTTFAIYGSAYVRGHYLICGISATGAQWGLLYNVMTEAWSRTSNVVIGYGLQRPSSPTQTFAVRAGPGPWTGGSIIRLESMIDAYALGSTNLDAGGVVPPFLITTRVLAADPATQKMFQRASCRYAQAGTAAGTQVAAKTGNDASDTALPLTNVGVLSATVVGLITSATNATPIVCTFNGHGLQTGDFVDIVAATGLTNMNGRWRINVLTVNTFELLGSTGNGAYGGSGMVRKVGATDMALGDLPRNAGVWFSVFSTTVPNFELHGFRIAYFDSVPVMSA